MERFTIYTNPDFERPPRSVWSAYYQATVRLVPTSIRGLAIVQVEGHGFLILDAEEAQARFRRLYQPECNMLTEPRPPVFLEHGYVYCPYIPDLTKK